MERYRIEGAVGWASLPAELLRMILVSSMPDSGVIQLSLIVDRDRPSIRDRDIKPGGEPLLPLSQADLKTPVPCDAYSPDVSFRNDEDLEARLHTNGASEEAVPWRFEEYSISVHPSSHKYNQITAHLVALAAINRSCRGFVKSLLRCSAMPPALSDLGAPRGKGQPVFRQMLGRRDECNLCTVLRGHHTVWAIDWEQFAFDIGLESWYCPTRKTKWWLRLGIELGCVTDFGFIQTAQMQLHGRIAPHHFILHNLPNLRRYYDIHYQHDAADHIVWRWVPQWGDERCTRIAASDPGLAVRPRAWPRTWAQDDEVFRDEECWYLDLHERLQNYSRGRTSSASTGFGPVEFERLAVKGDGLLMA